MASISSDTESSFSTRKRVQHLYNVECDSKRMRMVRDSEGPNKEDIEFESKFYHKVGLVNSLHGDIYQLKVLMLFLIRALGKDYCFQLGTEVDDAENFDDVVFRYKVAGEAGVYVVRAVQIKHKQEETKRITVSELSSQDGDYSMLKYFISYRNMKENRGFQNYQMKDITIYTNIDFNIDDLQKSSIKLNCIEENDEILKVSKFRKDSKRFKLSVPQSNELYEKLRETSDFHVLIKMLQSHLKENKRLMLNNDIFINYHHVLIKKVFYIEMPNQPIAKFRSGFVTGDNLSEDVKNFRNTLQSSLNIEDNNQFQRALNQLVVHVSNDFASFELSPIITDSKDLAKKMFDIIMKANHAHNHVHIRRTKGDIIDSNINKFAVHVLVQDAASHGLVKFSEVFFNERQHLKGDFDKFRTDLKQILQDHGIDFLTLKKYKFKIQNFYTCKETSLDVPVTNELYKMFTPHFREKKRLLLDTDNLNQIDYIFIKEMFEIEIHDKPIAKFRDDFVTGENLSDDAINFRSKLQLALKLVDNDLFQKKTSEMKWRVSNGFAQVDFEPYPIITDLKKLAKKISDLVIKARNEETKVITIKRRKGDVIDCNISKFAFNILVHDAAENEFVRFCKAFLNGKQPLKGNLDEFRTHFASFLLNDGIQLSELGEYAFKIHNFHTSEETSQGVPKYPKMELPTDTVEDTDIDEFLDKLVFAVNQPNEVDLDDIITMEMGKWPQFNLLDADLVSHSFQKNMLDWFKERRPEKGNEGVWLDATSGKKFINEIKNKIESLISVGLGIAYPEKLASYCIEFKENDISKKIKAFLSKNNKSKRILHIITSEDTTLSAINVYGTLKALQQEEGHIYLTKNDGYIFIRLQTLFTEKIRTYVMNAFKSALSYNFLIIDCRSNGPLRNIDIGQIYDKLTETLSQTSKKIIFIAHQQNVLIDQFAEDLKVNEVDNVSFGDLTEESKKILLQYKISFQGQRVSIDELIVKDHSDEEINTLIDIGIMHKLLNCENVNIGKELLDLGDTKYYYVHRKFQPTIFSKESILRYLEEKGIKSDLFVVCGADTGLNHFNAFVYDNVQSAEKKFNELLQTHTDSNIHWLKSDSKYFFWYKSYGTICNLLPYKMRQRVHNTVDSGYQHIIKESLLTEKDYFNDKMIIISDTAGMGKSTVLTHISMELKKKNSSLWVIRINLNDHTDILYEQKDNENKNAIEIIKRILSPQLQSILEQKLFANYYEKQGRIVFLFDGFDEISSTYKDIVIHLLLSLQKSQVRNIFVTTRPNVREDLERDLGVFSHLLDPFSKDDQNVFLTNFWTKKLQLENLNETYSKRLAIYVEFTINHISKHIHDKEQEFLSVPLQLMMLAEVFQDNRKEQPSEWQGCKEYLESGFDIPQMPKDFSIVKLYDLFVKKKFNDFYLKDKLRRTITIGDEIEETKTGFRKFKKHHELFALHLLCSQTELKELLTQADIKKGASLIKSFKKGKHNKGIVDEIIDGKPHFIHRTFAEYFASFPIAKKMLSAPVHTLRSINNIFLNVSPIFLTSIINQLDGKLETLTLALKTPLMHFVLVEMGLCTNFLKLLLQLNCETWHTKLDAFGKTPLHYAIELRHSDAVDKLLLHAHDIEEEDILDNGSLEKPEYENSLLVKFVNARDNDSKTALNYAMLLCDYDIAFKLLFKGANIDTLTDDHVRALIDHMLPDIVRCGPKTRYSSIGEKLFLRLPHVFNKLFLKEQSGILSYFFVVGRIQVIEVLLATISDFEKKNLILNNPFQSKTPLDRVLESMDLCYDEKLEVTKWLLTLEGFSINDHAHCSAIKHILLTAAENGEINIFKHYISEKEAEIFYEIINRACSWNQEIIVKYLYENYKDLINDGLGSTALHSACECVRGAKLEIIKYLIENGDVVNAANDNGETPLLIAVYKNRSLKLIEYLISKGANLNSEDNFGNTPLSRAIENDDIDIIIYFIKNKARISEKVSQLIKDKLKFFNGPDQYDLDLVIDDSPRLHTAIKCSKFEWAKFLIRRGADINKADIDGNTPLHLCCLMNDTENEVVELLLQYGAMFDLKNINNKTPRDLLSKSKNCDKVFWLLSILKELFSSQELMQFLNDGLLASGPGSNVDGWGPYLRCNVDLACPNCNPQNKSFTFTLYDGHGNIVISKTSNCNHVCVHNPIRYILNSRNSQQKALLHVAAETNDDDVINVLLKLNNGYLKEIKSRVQQYESRYFQPISIDSIDSQGNTPIHLAAQKGHTQIVSTLLDNGAIFNSNNYEGNTPEVLALNNNHSAVVELLLPIKKIFTSLDDMEIINYIKTKANLNVKNESGKTLLHIVASYNKPYSRDIALLLELNGADIRAVDENKDTALHIAAKNGNFDIVLQLLKWNEVIYDAKNAQGDKPVDLAHGQSRELLEQVETLFRGVQSDTPQIIFDILNEMKKKYSKNDIDCFVYMIRDQGGHNVMVYASDVFYKTDFKTLLYLLEQK